MTGSRPPAKLNKYPEVYSKLLLTLPADGTAIDIPFQTEEAAHDERLKFYNFLKFLRRNPREALHFGSRHNQVIVRRAGNVLSFVLRITAAETLEAGLATAAAQLSVPIASVPEHQLTVVRDEGDSIELPDFPADEPQEQINPLDLLNRTLEGDNK